MGNFNVAEVRKDFPFFEKNTLAYLDNSATSQRPESVLAAERDYLFYSNANPFRGLYELSNRATEEYEKSRETVARFIGAKSSDSIVFTRNATESLNLLAFSLSEAFVKEGDEIITSVVEHHSNLLPWQHAAKRHGAVVKYLHPKENGAFDPEELKALITERTKIVAVTHMSNIFGYVNDIKTFAEICHEKGAYLVVDGAQSVPHIPVNVEELDLDFLAFSGHKMLAPFGVGVLYGKKDLLNKMPPFLTGGEMIEHVSLDEVTYEKAPHRFEAGTVNASGAVALAEAIRYYEHIGFSSMMEWEEHLTEIALREMQKIPYVRVLGSEDPKEHHGILTFTIERVHPHDVASIFADSDVAVRAGHHCAEPLHQYLGIPSTTRCSLMFYNTEEEVKRFLDTLKGIRKLMGFAD